MVQTKSEKSRDDILKQVKDSDSNDDEDFIEVIWDDIQVVLSKSNNMREIHESLETAKLNEAILQKKNGMFDMLRDGLMEQDRVFLETVNEQDNTSDSLRALMDNHMSSAQGLFRDKLITIEEALEKDRRTIVEEQSSEISASIEKKKNEETNSLNSM